MCIYRFDQMTIGIIFKGCRLGLIALLGLLSGCVTRPALEPLECRGRFPAMFGKINIPEVMSDIASQFCVPREGPLNPLISETEHVVVPDFLELGGFSTGMTGMVLGETARGALSEVCRHKVRQIDLSKTIRLGNDGAIALTRDPGRIARSEFPSRWGYVGLYAEFPGKLLLSLRELDMESGATTRVVTKQVTYGCTIVGGEYKFSYQVN